MMRLIEELRVRGVTQEIRLGGLGLGTGVSHYEPTYRSMAFVDDLSPA